MSDMPNSPGPSGRPYGRPLSPHLQIYRWPITMVASITHRATGIALAAGLVLLAWWLIAAETGPDAYHLLNGIRHLVWDIGYGFNVPTARITAAVVFAASVLLAAGAFAVGMMVKAGLSV
jgi:succinate dehydrogenase / fumarate reductase, cytochrome b subunit